MPRTWKRWVPPGCEYNGSNLEHFSFESNECDAGQGEDKSGREISVPDLCATAIVMVRRTVQGAFYLSAG
jgi:hypothetical protein